MPLTREQKSRVEAAAESLGADPSEMVALAEQELAGEEGDSGGKESSAKKPDTAEVKIFAYHHPYMTVAEIRETIGMEPGGVPDPQMTSGEWLAKHGGGPAASAATQTPEPE